MLAILKNKFYKVHSVLKGIFLSFIQNPSKLAENKFYVQNNKVHHCRCEKSRFNLMKTVLAGRLF